MAFQHAYDLLRPLSAPKTNRDGLQEETSGLDPTTTISIPKAFGFNR